MGENLGTSITFLEFLIVILLSKVSFKGNVCSSVRSQFGKYLFFRYFFWRFSS